MNGKIIVFEGLDCSGKTTAINEIIKNDKMDRFIYSKGIGSKTWIGNFSRKFHCTFMFFIELLWNTLRTIKPAIKKGNIVLQDRYDISIASYVPVANRFYNSFFINFFRSFIIKPDALVYFTLPINERIERLKRKNTKYEAILARNPGLILIRDKEYQKHYDNFLGLKIKIDTLDNNISETAEIARRFIEKLL